MADEKRRRHSLNCKGVSIIEVLAAVFILILASQILVLGITFSAKMGKRSEDMEQMRRNVGEHLMEKSECTPGTVRLDMGGICEDIEGDGWLYAGEQGGDLSAQMNIIWVEMDMTNVYRVEERSEE